MQAERKRNVHRFWPGVVETPGLCKSYQKPEIKYDLHAPRLRADAFSLRKFVNLLTLQHFSDGSADAAESNSEMHPLVRFDSPLKPSPTSTCPLCRLLKSSITSDADVVVDILAHVYCGQASRKSGRTRNLYGLQVDVPDALRILPTGEDADLVTARQWYQSPTQDNFARPLVPGLASRDLVRSWLAQCKQSHDFCREMDKKSYHQMRTTAMQYLINSQDMCVEEVNQRPLDYLALSYVWGRTAQLKLLRSNHALLLSKGSLRKQHIPVIPQTIQDAIKFTREINEKYIWVDALCICQDDPVSRDSQLAIMNQIYKGASMTLVAVEAKDAASGLPGVEPYPSTRDRPMETINGIRFTTILPPLNRRIAELEQREGSCWSKRAWTYQEELLSRRLLFFTNDQLYFQCIEADFREDRYDSQHESDVILHPFDQHLGRYFYNHPTAIPKFTHWKMFVEEYSKRECTELQDRGLAFQGIAKQQEESWPTRNLAGLLSTRLPLTLAWHHGSYEDGIARAEETRIGAWSSWSWYGWTDPIIFPYFQLYRPSFTSITMHLNGEETTWKYNQEGRFPQEVPVNRLQLLKKYFLQKIKHSDEQGLEHEHLSLMDIVYHNSYGLPRSFAEIMPLEKPILSFKTTAASLHLNQTHFPEKGNIAIMTGLDKTCGVMYSSRDIPRLTSNNFEAYCILIGTSQRPFYRHNHHHRPPELLREKLGIVSALPWARRAKARQDYLSPLKMRKAPIASKLVALINVYDHYIDIETHARYREGPLGQYFLYVLFNLVLGFLSVVMMLMYLVGMVVTAGVYYTIFCSCWGIYVVCSVLSLGLWNVLLKPVIQGQEWGMVAHVMWIEDHGTHYERVAVGEMNYMCWKALQPQEKMVRLG